MGHMIGSGHQVTARLAGGIRAVGDQGITFHRGSLRNVPINLISADVEQTLQTAPMHHLQKDVCAIDIRLDEASRIDDAAVHVSLGGEVHNSIHAVRLHRFLQQISIADVALHEGISGVILHIRQVVQVSRIGELVVDGHLHPRIFSQNVSDEVASYESSTTSDQQPLQTISLPFGRALQRFGKGRFSPPTSGRQDLQLTTALEVGIPSHLLHITSGQQIAFQPPRLLSASLLPSHVALEDQAIFGLDDPDIPETLLINIAPHRS